jgi:hypothetical protein
LAAAATLDLLTGDREVGTSVEIRDRTGVHMPVHVERLADATVGSVFTVAHRHVGREPVPDPEVLLLRTAEGLWLPLSITLPLSHLVTATADGTVLRGRRGEHRRLVKLVEVWMSNVRVNLLKQDALEEQEISPTAAYAAE